MNKDQIKNQADLNIYNVQQAHKQELINDHSLKVMGAFSEYPMDYVLCVMQQAVATALIEYSGKETPEGNWNWNVVEALDNSSKFKENVDALIKVNHQNNSGLVIVEA